MHFSIVFGYVRRRRDGHCVGVRMGIYDRDYYREDSRWSNPFGRAQATVFLILLYVAIYILQIATRGLGKPGLTELLQLEIAAVLRGEVWRAFTYTLVHDQANFFHVLFTLLFLGWLGHQLEDLYGPKEFLAFFCLTSLLGGLAYTVVGALVPQLPTLVGPAGAVTSLFVLFALHFPTRTIWLFFLIPVPVWLLVIGYAVVDVFGLVGGAASPATSA